MQLSYIGSYLQKKIPTGLRMAILALVPAFLFLPFPDSVFDLGIDSPLPYIFTYLIRGHVALGKEIIFPHGPLAFIMYPLPGDSLWWIAFFFTVLLRMAWAYSLLSLVSKRASSYLFFAFLGAVVLSAVNGLLLTIVESVILFFLNYLDSKKITWLVPPLILIPLALFIKAFVGILCLAVFFSFILILLFYVFRKQENPWRLLYVFILPAGILIIWLLLYKTYDGLFSYIIGMQQLASDNSAAAALYPDNLWLWISVGILSGFLLLVLIVRNRKQLFFLILVLPTLFAIWKYAMARQDYYHALTIVIFLFFLLLVFHLLVAKQKYLHYTLSSLVFGAFLFNFISIRGPEKRYFPPHDGLVKLISAGLHYRYFSDTCAAASLRNVETNKLSSEIRSVILNKTVDVYPWDYSYVAANNLNWQPRPVLHSYAAYTNWLDNQDANHFKSITAPEFLIWELKASWRDIYGGSMESIDGRYLLNDEPETLLSLMSNYRLLAKQNGEQQALLYVKRQKPIELKTKEVARIETTWNTWFNVPVSVNGLLRASVHTSLTLAGRLKGMLYKDDDVYVFYMFSNGDIRQYRVVPRTIEYGLWVNPLIMNPETHINEPRVIKMCFRSRNENVMNSRINIVFSLSTPDDNLLPETDSSSFVFDFFGINGKLNRKTVLKRSLRLYQNPETWLHPVYGQPDTPGNTHQLALMPDKYSSIISVNLDSLKNANDFSDGLIVAQVWMKAGKQANAGLIVALEKGQENVLWKSADFKNVRVNENDYNLVSSFLALDEFMKKQKGLVLKVYLWNFGKEPVLWKNLSLHVEGVVQ